MLARGTRAPSEVEAAIAEVLAAAAAARAAVDEAQKAAARRLDAARREAQKVSSTVAAWCTGAQQAGERRRSRRDREVEATLRDLQSPHAPSEAERRAVAAAVARVAGALTGGAA